jgi:hypothetical protein
MYGRRWGGHNGLIHELGAGAAETVHESTADVDGVGITLWTGDVGGGHLAALPARRPDVEACRDRQVVVSPATCPASRIADPNHVAHDAPRGSQEHDGRPESKLHRALTAG